MGNLLNVDEPDNTEGQDCPVCPTCEFSHMTYLKYYLDQVHTISKDGQGPFDELPESTQEQITQKNTSQMEAVLKMSSNSQDLLLKRIIDAYISSLTITNHSAVEADSKKIDNYVMGLIRKR